MNSPQTTLALSQMDRPPSRSLSFRQKSFSVNLELHTKILSGAKNYPDFQEFFVSQNNAKNAGRSLKNAGMREIG